MDHSCYFHLFNRRTLQLAVILLEKSGHMGIIQILKFHEVSLRLMLLNYQYFMSLKSNFAQRTIYIKAQKI